MEAADLASADLALFVAGFINSVTGIRMTDETLFCAILPCTPLDFSLGRGAHGHTNHQNQATND